MQRVIKINNELNRSVDMKNLIRNQLIHNSLNFKINSDRRGPKITSLVSITSQRSQVTSIDGNPLNSYSISKGGQTLSNQFKPKTPNAFSNQKTHQVIRHFYNRTNEPED